MMYGLIWTDIIHLPKSRECRCNNCAAVSLMSEATTLAGEEHISHPLQTVFLLSQLSVTRPISDFFVQF